MKIECIKEKLAASISKAEKITAKNSPLPVLKCVLLETKGSDLLIRATNLDLGIEFSIPVKVERPGRVAIPGGILSSYLSNIQGKNVSLEVSDGNLMVTTEASSTVIKAIPHEEFPSIPDLAEEKSFEMNSADFIEGLRSVWYSSSTSTMKPELSSVFIYPDAGSVIFVATDSFRLAEKKVKVKHDKDFQQILIPFKNIPDIIRTFEEVKDDITIRMTKNQISFVGHGIYLTSRIIDGVFPDYKQILPKEFKTEAIVLKQDLLSALKVANIFSDTFHQINVKVDPDRKLFQLKTKNSDVGENVNKIDGALSGDAIDINFNYKYIVDCFQSLNSDSVALHFSALNRPMVITGVSDKSFLYLVMPMNK